MRHGQVAIAEDLDHVTVEGYCTVTGQKYAVNHVPFDGLERWEAGELVQKALPTLSPDEREFLISGTSPAGWRQLFGEEE